VKAITPRSQGFRVNVNTTLFDGADARRFARFFDDCTDNLKVDGITVSPGYAYERAPDKQHFLNRNKTRTCPRPVPPRQISPRGEEVGVLELALFLDFLAGNQQYHCTHGRCRRRNVFGWQKPCLPARPKATPRA